MQHDYGKAEVARFLAQLHQAATAVLLLDYDGTLAPFQVVRDRAHPYPGVIAVLDHILRSGKTEVSVVSGRPACEVQALLNPLGGIEIWGAHGLDHLSADGTYRSTNLPSDILAALARAEEWLRGAGLSHMAEIKPGGIAIHWRGLTDSEIGRVKARAREGWDQVASDPGIKYLEFEGGLELRVARPDKGDTVSAILKRISPQAPVAFLGDDRTDEDAFRALGRRGLSILVRPEYRTTRADAWLRPPQDLIDFLQHWAEALPG